jgi:hypothetical protein
MVNTLGVTARVGIPLGHCLQAIQSPQPPISIIYLYPHPSANVSTILLQPLSQYPISGHVFLGKQGSILGQGLEYLIKERITPLWSHSRRKSKLKTTLDSRPYGAYGLDHPGGWTYRALIRLLLLFETWANYAMARVETGKGETSWETRFFMKPLSVSLTPLVRPP